MTGVRFFCFLAVCLIVNCVKAQNSIDSKFGKGINVIAKDSSFSMKFSTRFQTLYEGVYDRETAEYSDKLLIRRARLKFDGFVYNPRLEYKIELGLSNNDIGNGDIIPESNFAPLQILDAVVKYNFYGDWEVWFGQTKLPGNIERVISSQALQFVDRSFVNSRFNIDRDRGIQLYYNGSHFKLKSAISMGEGRSIESDNTGGYDYTVRGEWLPFGNFAAKGDYFGSDLKREPMPKLMVGVTYDYNDRAVRQRGQLGRVFSESRTLTTWFADAHFKYRGVSVMAEYADKKAPEGSVVADGAFYTGKGFNIQGGYLFANNLEPAFRYTLVAPSKESLRRVNRQYTLGLSKYIVEHSLKIQTDVTWIDEDGDEGELMCRFQMEVAF